YLSSTGAEIVGNHINRVVGVRVICFPCGGFIFTFADGIDVFGTPGDPQQAITGRLTIANNTIENLNSDFSIGVQLDEVAADTEIRGNTVHFQQSNGFLNCWGLAAFRSSNRVTIENNTVNMGPGSLEAYPTGIGVGGGHAGARYFVRGNTIITEHTNADGIDALGFGEGFGDDETTEGARIEGNHVKIQSSGEFTAGIGFYGDVNNSIVAANQIEGTAWNGFQLLGRQLL